MIASVRRVALARIGVAKSGGTAAQRRLASQAKSTLKDAPPAPPPPPSERNPAGSALWPATLISGAALLVYLNRETLGLGGPSSAPQGAAPGSGPASAQGDGLDKAALKSEVEELGRRIQAEEDAEKARAVAAVALAADKQQAEAAAAKAAKEPVDYVAVRKAIADILDEEGYDDGSIGPLLVRLAWHHAGTYDAKTKRGGSEGACMRFQGGNEASWGANAGLGEARARLEPIKKRFPGITYSDLWSLAGTVALEEMGAPAMKWRPGRTDKDASSNDLPDGLLPDADGRGKAPAEHLRDIFYRMGFSDREIVALSGAHALGRCHVDRSGFVNPWTRAPTTLSNDYFRLLLEETWSKKRTHQGKEWKGPLQYENASTGADLMMLETDLALVTDSKFKPFVELYAKDEQAFLKDFAAAWIKLQELGVRRFHGRRKYWLFGPRV